jgi:hypothetical protein
MRYQLRLVWTLMTCDPSVVARDRRLSDMNTMATVAPDELHADGLV